MKEKRFLVRLKDNFDFLRTIKNPLTYLRDCSGMIKGRYVSYSLNSGQKFKVRANTCDRGIIKEIFFYHCYDPKGFAIGEQDIVFDIGAQAGIFSVYAANLAKKGKVYSFEPMPENFQMLKDNIYLNDCDNVLAFNSAIGAEDGRRDLFLSSGNTGGHSFLPTRQENIQKTEVSVLSLAKFIERENIDRIDFLKIDCEGAEYEIFFNLPAEILAKIKKISMEYHDLDEARNGEKMKEFLAAHGYQVEITTGKFPMIYASR